jgi:hypothetical protein
MPDLRLGQMVILASPYGQLARGYAVVPNGARGQIVDHTPSGAVLVSFAPEPPNHDRIELEVPVHWLTAAATPEYRA